MPSVFILNGPNLNLLGKRQPAISGRGTLGDIEKACHKRAKALGRYEFQFVMAPLVVRRGTASPVNPIAVF